MTGYGMYTGKNIQQDASRDSRSDTHGCRPWPILTEYLSTPFVPMNKYGTVENSTPHAKDDYNSRFTYVSSSSAQLQDYGLMRPATKRTVQLAQAVAG